MAQFGEQGGAQAIEPVSGDAEFPGDLCPWLAFGERQRHRFFGAGHGSQDGAKLLFEQRRHHPHLVVPGRQKLSGHPRSRAYPQYSHAVPRWGQISLIGAAGAFARAAAC